MSYKSPQTLVVEEEQRGSGGAVINDFSIQVATVNGSGSQSSNTVLMRSIFQMGIPVSGKNLFPSNIAGLPTWFTIRANKDGWIARRKEIDFLVAMNPETAREDVMGLDPNRVVVYEETLKANQYRRDLTFFFGDPMALGVGPIRLVPDLTDAEPESLLRALSAQEIHFLQTDTGASPPQLSGSPIARFKTSDRTPGLGELTTFDARASNSVFTDSPVVG